MALGSLKLKSAPALDRITYQVIKERPEGARDNLLRTLNEMLEGCIYPQAWKDTLVKSIPKGADSDRFL